MVHWSRKKAPSTANFAVPAIAFGGSLAKNMEAESKMLVWMGRG